MTYESKKHFGDRRNISREKTTTLNALSRKTYLSTLSSKTCRFMQNAKPLAGTEYEYRDTIDGNAPALPPVPDDSPTPCPRQRLTLATLCLAVLIAQIDTAVVNLAVEPIRASFQAGITALQWVVDRYKLVSALLLPRGGLLRSEERRGGKECVGPGRSRWGAE